MKKFLLSLFALCCFSAVMAQQKTRNLSVELLGAQNIVGINYDRRFDGNSGLGYRIGIGYGYGDNSGLFDQKINGVGVPLELNYLLGKKNSKLELGFGASLGVYQVKETIGYVKDTGWYPDGENTDETSPKIDFYTSSKTQFGYFLFGNHRLPLSAPQRIHVSCWRIAVLQFRRQVWTQKGSLLSIYRFRLVVLSRFRVLQMHIYASGALALIISPTIS